MRDCQPRDDFPPLPLPIPAVLPDGTTVRVEAVRIPALGGLLLAQYREIWQVVPATTQPSGDEWLVPLAFDYTPALAVEEAWFETLVQRRAHLNRDSSMPLRPRFLALHEVVDCSWRTLTRSAWSATYDTLDVAREGYEAYCAGHLAEHGYTPRVMLFDREALRCIAITTPGYQFRHDEDRPAATWLIPRRGRFTGSKADDTPPPNRAHAGLSAGRDELVVAVPETIQEHLDAVVAWAHAGTAAESSRKSVCDYIEEHEPELASWGEPLDKTLALPAHFFPDECELDDLEDDDVRERLGLAADVPIGAAERLRYFGAVTLPALYEEADYTPMMAAAWLTARDGRQAILVNATTGYSFSGIQVEWHGPYRDWASFVAWLDMAGWIRDVKAWQQLDAGYQRRYFR